VAQKCKRCDEIATVLSYNSANKSEVESFSFFLVVKRELCERAVKMWDSV
jgi:hypothetical protein